MDVHILPAGWREWHPGKTDYLPTAFYAEYQSSGPGADALQREPRSSQLTSQQAEKFEPQDFLRGSDGWNPSAILKQKHSNH
jgi:hypothetical protein